jgi:5-methylcytosine-specific restriction endonuclease McrA
MSLRACLGCGELIGHGSRCGECTPKAGHTYAYQKKRAAMLKPGTRCYICGDPATQIDHVIPVIKGGTDHPSNLRPICWPCNREKSDR